jgi:hypothetical protein
VHSRGAYGVEGEPGDVIGGFADGGQDALISGMVVDVPEAINGDGEITEIRAVVFREPAFRVL